MEGDSNQITDVNEFMEKARCSETTLEGNLTCMT